MTLLLCGCSGSSGTTAVAPAPSAPATPLPDMWRSIPDKKAGFSVALPTSWDVVTRDSPTFDADLKAVGDQGPELAKYFTDAFGKNDQLRLLGADPRTLPQGFAANINVMTSDLGTTADAPTLDDVAKAKAKSLAAAAGVQKPVLRQADKMSGLGAVRFDYTLTANGTAVQVRSLVATVERGGRRFLVELTMGAPAAGAPSLFAAEQALFTLFDPSRPSPSPSPSRAATPTPTTGGQGSQTSSG
jgi:hypothetical protein